MTNEYLSSPLETLSALRNGQPTSAFMLSLSSKADRAIKHLLKEFERKAKVVKVLIGDPGDGKSTFEAAIFSRLNEIPHAIPVRINLSASLRFKPKEFMVSLILSQELMVSAALALKNIQETDSQKNQEILDWMKTKKALHLFRFFSGWSQKMQANQENKLDKTDKLASVDQAGQINQTANVEPAIESDRFSDESPINDIYDFHRSIRSWFIEPMGTKSQLSRCYVQAGGYVGRVPDAPKGFSEIFSVLAEFIEFYSLLGLYPVWSIDEFESISLLQRDGRNLLLSAVREIIDTIFSPAGTGCLMICTTNDGLTYVENYPALNDRLFSSRKFTLPNIYWEVKTFSIWDTEKALNTLTELYELGAKQGDLTCQAVVEVLPLHFETLWFRDYIHSVLASEIPARSRLKHIIVEILDVLSEGSFEEQCEYFAKEKYSTSRFKKSLEKPLIPVFDPLTRSAQSTRTASLDSGDMDFSVFLEESEDLESLTASIKLAQYVESVDSLKLLSSTEEIIPDSDQFLSFSEEKKIIGEKSFENSLGEFEIPLAPNFNEGFKFLEFDLDQKDIESFNFDEIEETKETKENKKTSKVQQLNCGENNSELQNFASANDNSDILIEIDEDVLLNDIKYNKIIKYAFYKSAERSKSITIKSLTNIVKKSTNLSTIGNQIAYLRDIGRLDMLPDDVVKGIKEKAEKLSTFKMTLDDVTEELDNIFILSASRTRNGESKRNFLGLVNSKREVGVDFVQVDKDNKADKVLIAGDDSIIVSEDCSETSDDFKKALFNPCYSIGAMRSFSYQFFLQRGHLPPDSLVDSMVLRIARTDFNYRLAPSRSGIKFIREKNGGIIDLFRQSEILLSNAELTVSDLLYQSI